MRPETAWNEIRQVPLRVAALLVVAMATSAACTTRFEPRVTAPWFVPPDPGWTDCEGRLPTGTRGAQCGSLRVPVSWTDGTGPTIDLELVRMPASDPARRIGAVVVLSGGPGGSGIDDLSLVASLLPEVGARFDLVAHRPRTVIGPGSIPHPVADGLARRNVVRMPRSRTRSTSPARRGS